LYRWSQPIVVAQDRNKKGWGTPVMIIEER
jgi:hypothetical protein